MEELNISMKDLALHDIQLLETRLSKVHCEVYDKKECKDSGGVNIQISTKGRAIDEINGCSIISVVVENELFKFDITQRGDFRINGNIKIDKKDFEKFLSVQGIRILWSYARESIFELSCKMLRKPLMLPTLDVIKTIRNSEEHGEEE